jgi:hypothetical protein
MITMYKEVFNLTMLFIYFLHVDLILKNFLLQFQKSPERDTHGLAMAS